MDTKNLKYIELPKDFEWAEIRPRFKFDLELKPKEIVQRFQHFLSLENAPCQGQADETYATLFYPKNKRNYWSPQLTLLIEEEEFGSHVRGLYGPRPAVWTMFVFFYALIGLLVIFASVIGGSQYMLGKSSWVIWTVPILLALFGSLYMVAQAGKKKGRPEMKEMHHFLMHILGLKSSAEN